MGIKSPPKLVENPSFNAEVAGSLAISKSRVESPMLQAIQSAQPNQTALEAITDQAAWNQIAQLYAADAKLDANSISLIKAKKLQSANNQADNLSRLVSKFETTMALDTVRNEYKLHSQIHEWFIQGNQTGNVETLNEQVYAQLFLTPNSDPWLGLLPSDTYSAIDNEGIRPSTSQELKIQK